MMLRLARPYAVIGWLAAIVGAIGGTVFRLVDPVPLVSDALGFGDVSLVGFAFLGLSFASVGALLVIRRPENAVGWVMVMIGAGNSLAVLAGAIASSAVADGPAGAPVAAAAAWLGNLSAMLGGFVLGLGFIFPTGRGHTPRWDRFIKIGAVVLVGSMVVLMLIRPGPLQIFASIDNPLGFGPDLRSVLGVPVSSLIVASPALTLPVTAWSIASRYRLADRTGRQQLKWFILALLVAMGGFAVAGLSASIGDEPPAAGLVVFSFAGAFVPVAIGIAILRHNLYDIDRIVSRTIAYAIVSTILALVFGGAVVLVSAALSNIVEGQTIAVAASTLIAFTIAQPLLGQVRQRVDRRFDRARYDAEQTVERFAARLRDQTDLTSLRAELDATISAAMAPTTTGIWIRQPPRTTS